MLREDIENIFFTRLAIYLCDIKFEHIGLQKLLTNSFVYDRVHYSEMYSLVRNRINELDSNDISLTREFIDNKSITLNGDKVESYDFLVTKSVAIEQKYIVIRRGKKKYYILRFI